MGSVAGKRGVECGAVLSDEFSNRVGTIGAGLKAMYQSAYHGAANDDAVGYRTCFDSLLRTPNAHTNKDRQIGVFLGPTGDLDGRSS